jgi:predicted DNA binding CopG/RHH family protein
MHWKKIHKLATKLSQNMLESLDYLKHYNKAYKQVEQKLTNNKHQEYKAMAKEWLEKKLPLQM